MDHESISKQSVNGFDTFATSQFYEPHGHAESLTRQPMPAQVRRRCWCPYFNLPGWGRGVSRMLGHRCFAQYRRGVCIGPHATQYSGADSEPYRTLSISACAGAQCLGLVSRRHRRGTMFGQTGLSRDTISTSLILALNPITRSLTESVEPTFALSGSMGGTRDILRCRAGCVLLHRER